MIACHRWAAAFLAISGMAIAGTAMAQPDGAAIQVDIPAQDLDRALILLGRQARLSLLFDPALVRGERSRRVRGAMTPARALEKMLAGAPLTFRRAGDRTLVVVAAPRRPRVRAQVVQKRRPAAVVERTAAAADHALSEIIVTAQKKAERLQDLPISIVTMDEDDIRLLRIDEIGDLGNAIPNVQMQPHPSGQSSPLIAIRGIGASDNQITQDPSVAVYIDGVYVARVQDMGRQIVDLERVEVLRGPQGTLYGRNATGGAINFITRPAQLGEWALDASATIGSLAERSGHAALNFAMGDALAGRLSYQATRRDGPVRNLGTGAKSFGAMQRDAWRADLRWEPDGDWHVRYTLDRSATADTAFYIQAAPNGDATTRPTTSLPGVRDFKPGDIVSQGQALTIDWKASDALAVKSISAYRNLRHFSYQDYLSGGQGESAALIGASDIHQKQWSQEFQFLGTAFDDRLDYVAGIYYFGENAHGLSSATLPRQDIVLHTLSAISNRAYAVYAQGALTPHRWDGRLHVTLAGRWSRDERTAAIAHGVRTIAQGPAALEAMTRGRREFRDFSPAATVAFDLARESMVYAKVSKGYKSGGFNLRSSTAESFRRGFNPEQVTSYEIGLKSELFDRRLRLNLAAFHADYGDIQLTFVNVGDPTTSNTLNAGSAAIDGAELDLTATPFDGLLLEFHYAWLNPDYSRIVDADGHDITQSYRFTAPASSFSVRAVARLAETALGTARLHVNYSWQGGHPSATVSGGRFDFPSFGLVNARLELVGTRVGDRSGTAELALWAKNLADAKYWFMNGSVFGGYRAWGEGRTIGAELRFRF